MQPPAAKFGTVAIALHWLIAALIVAAATAGLISSYTNDAALTRESLNFHQSIGIAVFALAAVRLLWRLTHSAPALPASMPHSHRIAATIVHVLLYLLLFALPATGYIALTARGRDVSFFGLFDLPHLVPRNLAFSATVQNLHDNGEYVLYALVLAHIGAALYHQFVLKDGIMGRMWFGRTKSDAN